MVSEYNSSLVSENKIPNHYFENISIEIKRLAIENSFLETDGFLKIATVSETVNEVKKFLKKFQSYFPRLFDLSDQVELTSFIIDAIFKILPLFPNASCYSHYRYY